MSNILVLGYLGLKKDQLDGQTVKTRELYKLLKTNNFDCDYFDTQEFKYRKCSVLSFIKKIMKTKTIYYVPAQNNLKYIFPVLYLIAKLFKIKIYYFVVGGWLVEFLENRPLHRHFLSKISRILPETQYMIDQLSINYCFNNLNIFPNFRFQDVEIEFSHSSAIDGRSAALKVVFVSRIVEEKGLKVIENFCNYLVSLDSNMDIIVDFFGLISEKDSLYFEDFVSKYNFVNYKGVLQPSEITKTLKLYDVLVLPTRYYTEGLPGAIVDAYMAGIPVIVTEWKHSHEFVKHLETGFIVPFDNPNDEFIDSVMRLYQDRGLLLKMKKNAFYESFNYSDKYAWDILKSISKF